MPNNAESGERTPIRVQMLGGFRIESGRSYIQDADARTHQLWHLIEYLIIFRRRQISQSELIGVLWPGGEIDNPGNALKNLIYRIRTKLSAQDMPYAKEMILFSHGRYHWNNSLPLNVDFEEFEELYRRAEAPQLEPRVKTERYLTAIALYKGDFLPNSRLESWVAQLGGYYRSLYFKCVASVLALLGESGRYAEMERICRAALKIDPFDETANRQLVLAVARQGRQKEALEYYTHITEMFFREMGVNPSKALRGLYSEIATTVSDVESDIDALTGELAEEGEGLGAYYCEYEVFKRLYRLESRLAGRSGQAVFLCLLTVFFREDAPETKQRNKILDGLFEIIQEGLRRGDVFSRYSSTQFVLLLPTLTMENCDLVLDRVVKQFRQLYRAKNADIKKSFKPLVPVELPR